MELCILASGSAGNCTVVRAAGGAMLLDAGIGPRAAARRLEGTGVGIGDISAICLTHLDTDHFNPGWIRTIVRQGIGVFCHALRRDDLTALAPAEPAMSRLVRTFERSVFEPLPGLRVRPLPLAHDVHGSHGFVLESGGVRAGYATDLGAVPPQLVDHFAGVDILAIESNYDVQMQMASSRPWFLKQRIMGGRGHLSNEQALEAVRAILDRARRAGLNAPQHIVLLHRSRQCNCPRLLQRLFGADPRVASRLVLAEQYQRTQWLSGRPCRRPPAGERLALLPH